MKRRKLILLALVLGVAMAAPVTSAARNPKGGKTATRTIVGFISDNHCGLKHMDGMESDKACVLMCVANGKFVLADRDQKKVYQLDDTGQQKAREFAGQKVKVTGRVTGNTIHVTTIEAA
ncbi:MAG: hypothetical protein QOF62_3439 [Pyrinomonadaceae bacterium]|jgi:hypothetical protein|nr:hypothetical protein [Pyrinomonadaceae bacterium]